MDRQAHRRPLAERCLNRAAWLVLPAAAAIIAAACNEGTPACFESGATAYPIHAPGNISDTFRWPRGFHPVRIYAEPVGEMPANVDASIALWLGVLHCGELSLVRVTDSTTADIVVRNPAQMPAPGPSAISAAADSAEACEGRTDFELDLDDDVLRPIRSYVVPIGLDPAASTSCYRFVTAHEIGHALGLLNHSPNGLDLMSPAPYRRLATPNDAYTFQLLHHQESVSLRPVPR